MDFSIGLPSPTRADNLCLNGCYSSYRFRYNLWLNLL